MFVRSENKKVIIRAESIYVKRVELDEGVFYKVKASGLSRRTPITLKTFDQEDEALSYMDGIMKAVVA